MFVAKNYSQCHRMSMHLDVFWQICICKLNWWTEKKLKTSRLYRFTISTRSVLNYYIILLLLLTISSRNLLHHNQQTMHNSKSVLLKVLGCKNLPEQIQTKSLIACVVRSLINNACSYVTINYIAARWIWIIGWFYGCWSSLSTAAFKSPAVAESAEEQADNQD